ncbi:MAG: ATPase V [Bacteroidales bacterium]|nr:ATPase V [Bacteroidales bacterium]
MMKYSFILLSGETEGFLEKLQELGVVDVTRSAKPVDDCSAAMLDTVVSDKKVIGKLEGLNFTKDTEWNAIQQAGEAAVLEGDLAVGAQTALVQLAELELAKSAAEKEMAARLPWGDFDKARLAHLESLGYAVRYYRVPEKKFSQEWAALYPLEVISEDKANVWFVTVAPKGDEYTFPVEPIAAPEGSWKEAEAEVKALNEQIIKAKGLLVKYQSEIPAMQETDRQRLVDLEMYLAKASTEQKADNMLSVLEGFAPVENDEQLCKTFDEMGVLYIREDAAEQDNPPIRLKNGWFASLFEVLTGMYGMPGYKEFDPTPILAPFYLLFFAMCMGDAGYGLVLILFGLGVTKKLINIDMFKNIGPLISVLGVGTLVVGLVLGTAFGINLAEAAWYPAALKKFMITGDIAGFPAQMILALGIGVFHICLAMVVKAIGYTKRFGFKENVSTWGWLILILGGLILAAVGMTNLLSPVAMKIAVIALAVVSGLGIFIFNTPGKNPLANIGSGLWDTYNMITGLLGDVLSYIRLYALGLAGGMLGQAFNILGGMMVENGFGPINWLPFALIVLFGHTLNLAMSCLGAFVHPLRLTFVEYFKNAGYEGKGKEYSPLKK